MSRVKVYLDFQIFDQCSKNPDIKDHIINQNRYVYYCSTAHLEELYRAIKNAKTTSNLDQAQAIRETIKEICSAGILNPGPNGVQLKTETLEVCLRRIKKYDTTQTVEENAMDLKNLHNQSPEFSSCYHQSAEKWKAIWEEPLVKERIDSANNTGLLPEQIYKLYSDLVKIYGAPEAKAQILRFNGSICHISRGCFHEIKNSYDKLEYTIERLARILSSVGYFRDKNIRTFNSGEYDITHMIYSSFCDYFVTEDKRLYNKAMAMNYYLQIPTKVITFDSFQELLSNNMRS